MSIEDLQLGAKITLSGNREYRIINIRKEDEKDYIVCCTNKPPILPVVFEYRVDGEKIKVRLEKNNEILKTIFVKIIEENS